MRLRRPLRGKAQHISPGWFVVAAVGTLIALANCAQPLSAGDLIKPIALYPEDHRRPMRTEDYQRFPGAGVLFCRDDNNAPRKAAASWLIGSSRLVMMNAHNFRDRRAMPTRSIEDCFFQIGGRNYEFDPKSVRFGLPAGAVAMHITDDWVIVKLQKPVEANVPLQPLPKTANLPTGLGRVAVTMVSPAGHANLRTTPSSIEQCHIEAIDPPSEDGIRRARHDCNDGFGGSGSGLFDEAGHLIAMQSASLDMNRRLPFDLDLHYGSALLIEGALLDALRKGAAD